MQEGLPRRLGDRVVRRAPRLQTERVRIMPERPHRAPPPVALLLLYGFLALILVGTVLLLLPISAQAGQQTDLLTALFTATSAVCVTGLVVVDTAAHWSPFGQAVILALFQVGGLGFMTAATVLFLVLGRRITLRERLLLRESVGGSLGGVERVALQVVIFALVSELIGIVVLFFVFLEYYSPLAALWQSAFHAVSAFNNAGFSITPAGQSLVPYQSNAFVLVPVAVLIVLGGISFTVVRDFSLTRNWRGLTLDSKLVLTATGILLVLGAVIIFLSELDNPSTLGRLPLWSQVMNAVFASVTSRTAGFNTIDTGALRHVTLFFVLILMLIGGASGSTAGGIKVNTFAVVAASILTTLRGRERTEVFSREIPEDQSRRALTIAALALIWVNVTVFILSAIDGGLFIQTFFEAVSALGTVGLSTGITPDLSAASKLVLIVTMFIGRLGPLTIGLALAARQQQARFRRAQERVKIG